MEVIRQITPEKREVYNFAIFDLNAVFNGYRLEEKTKRQRIWRVVDSWDYYRSHGNRTPPLSNEVRELIRQTLIEMIKVYTFPEWKVR